VTWGPPFLFFRPLLPSGWFPGVPCVELRDCVWGISEVLCVVPGGIGVVETSLLDSILDLPSMVLGVNYFLDFLLFFIVEDNW
jgi:hypothetical protein